MELVATGWEHFMDDSDKFRLVIGTEAGESRAIDAIEEVLKSWDRLSKR